MEKKQIRDIYFLETEKEFKIMQDYNSSNMGIMAFNKLQKTDCGIDGTKENAERIVKCWNEYDKIVSDNTLLVEALETLTNDANELNKLFFNDAEWNKINRAKELLTNLKK